MVLAVQDDAWTESCRFMGLDVLALCGATLASARASRTSLSSDDVASSTGRWCQSGRFIPAGHDWISHRPIVPIAGMGGQGWPQHTAGDRFVT
jgi:hypothetical protein